MERVVFERRRPMKKLIAVLVILGACLIVLVLTGVAWPETRARVTVNIPDVLGYRTLKCDFHIHTVFSDGLVWPDIRSEEAWREGLDAIAITDHIEYQPHKDDIRTAHNRSYEIAAPRGVALGVTVIRGSEITRKMPPGHLNAVLIRDAEALDTKSWRDSVRAAHDQGAFIFWNHPGWEGQQPDEVAKWYPEHTELVERGLLHGIEVVNSREYYPEAHRWCIEKNLTMLSNSDIHNPLNLNYDVHNGDHRPLTLVFATENNVAAIREALFARRTAVYSGKMLIGEENFLRAIFEESIRLRSTSLSIKGDGEAYLQVSNQADLDFELVLSREVEEISVPRTLVLQAHKTVLLKVSGKSAVWGGSKRITLSYTVDNLKIAPEKGLPVELHIEVVFVPDGAG